MEEDPYDFLANYYGISEQKVMDCVDRTHDLLNDPEINSDQVAAVISRTIKDKTTKSMFEFLKTKLSTHHLEEAQCESTSVRIKEPFPINYLVNDYGVINMDISLPSSPFSYTSEGIHIHVYKGIIDDWDPYQEEEKIYLKVGSDTDSYEFTNGEIFEHWEFLTTKDKEDLFEVPGLVGVLEGRSVDVIVAELISLGRYIWGTKMSAGQC